MADELELDLSYEGEGAGDDEYEEVDYGQSDGEEAQTPVEKGANGSTAKAEPSGRNASPAHAVGVADHCLARFFFVALRVARELVMTFPTRLG